MDDDIPYLLLTPGPITTSRTVREAMLRDYCTWDVDYNSLVNRIRARIVTLAEESPDEFTSVLMQGSGTFVVESVVGSVIPPDGRLLIVINGAYGARIARIAERLRISRLELDGAETEPPRIDAIDNALGADPSITHVAVVHCETTTGMLNPVEQVGEVVARHGRSLIVDAMSSFGGVPISMRSLSADYLISSANKCIQGTPGFGFVVARRSRLEQTAGWARSLSLDLFDQWREMETNQGKWRFTSPTHVVRAFWQALEELDEEGGISARGTRYRVNQSALVEGMQELGFRPLLRRELQSPIITAFHFPDDPRFTFASFYDALKRRRFVIYPGKVSHAETFRIGTIGQVFAADIDQLLLAVREATEQLGISM